MERQATQWEKISTNYVSDKEFVSVIYKQFSKLNIKNQQIQLEMGKRHKQTYHFTDEDIWTANDDIKRC